MTLASRPSDDWTAVRLAVCQAVATGQTMERIRAARRGPDDGLLPWSHTDAQGVLLLTQAIDARLAKTPHLTNAGGLQSLTPLAKEWLKALEALPISASAEQGWDRLWRMGLVDDDLLDGPAFNQATARLSGLGPLSPRLVAAIQDAPAHAYPLLYRWAMRATNAPRIEWVQDWAPPPADGAWRPDRFLDRWAHRELMADRPDGVPGNMVSWCLHPERMGQSASLLQMATQLRHWLEKTLPPSDPWYRTEAAGVAVMMGVTALQWKTPRRPNEALSQWLTALLEQGWRPQPLPALGVRAEYHEAQIAAWLLHQGLDEAMPTTAASPRMRL